MKSQKSQRNWVWEMQGSPLEKKKNSRKVTLMMKGFASAWEDIKDEVLQRPLSIHQLTANYTKHLVKKYLADVSNKEAKLVPCTEG